MQRNAVFCISAIIHLTGARVDKFDHVRLVDEASGLTSGKTHFENGSEGR